MEILDGKKIARDIRDNIKDEIARLGIKPGLAAILVGSDQASALYVKLKEKACEEAGIYFEKIAYPAKVSESEVLEKIGDLNSQKDIHGILVQLPLPAGLDENKIIQAIDPRKDADGFHPENLALLANGDAPLVYPGLVAGIMRLIDSSGESIGEKSALVIANSEIFSQPMKYALKEAGASANSALPDDPDLDEKCRAADILIACIGRPEFIKSEMIKNGAIVIDVGTNKINGKLLGDVEAEGLDEKNGFRTPVPGGVGPITVAMLLTNTLEAAKKSTK